VLVSAAIFAVISVARGSKRGAPVSQH